MSAGGRPILTSISCPAVDACSAAGLSPSDGNLAVASQASGGTWTGGTQPVPSGAGDSAGTDISCWKPRHCIVLGRHGPLDYYAQTGYVATSSGDAWTISELPIPQSDTAPSAPVGASCSADGYCAVTGWAADAASKYHRNGLVVTGTPPGG